MRRLVLIDDNPKILRHYEEILKADKSIEVAGKALDGKQGLELIRRKKPDLILLDIIMPRMDGISMLKAMSELPPEIRRPEVIVVSAVGQEVMVEQAFSLGARFYLMKPFEDSVLLEQVHQSLGDDRYTAQIVSDTPAVYNSSYEPPTLEQEVSETLITLGVPAHIRGYH